MLTVSNTIFSSTSAASGVWRNVSNWINLSLHITGLEGNVWVEASNDPSVLTAGAGISAPAIPGLSQYTPTADQHIAGVSANTTYYVKTTYVTVPSLLATSPPTIGETVASTEANLLVTAGNLLVVNPPAKDAGGYASGWNCYISTTSGNEAMQNLEDNVLPAPLGFGQIFTLKNLVNSRITVPLSNTSGSPNSGVNLTGNLAASNYAPPTASTQIQILVNPISSPPTPTQVLINPSGIAFNFIRVCKDTTAQTKVTTGFLFGQVG